MSPRYRTVLLVATSFVGGVLITTGSAYLAFRPISQLFTSAAIMQTAARGKDLAQVLQQLRYGDTTHPIQTLEVMVDLDTLTLGSYRRRTLDNDLQERVRDSLTEIREYRRQFPTTQSGHAREVIEADLGLTSAPSNGSGP
jgi:hypothetical protein